MQRQTVNQSTGNQTALDPSWSALLEGEFQKPYMLELKLFLQREVQGGKTIFPPGADIFRALNTTAFESTKVVILGQDPYHGPRQAHGLCFSVQPGQAIPPSLRNIYRELAQDLCIQPPTHGYLMPWAQQGVLLLNSVLTVEQGNAGSHRNKGWEDFTDRIISCLNERRNNLVFLLWGSYAHRKGEMISRERHLVLTSTHPSPLSAHRGFLGCRHFSKANRYLKENGITPINWQLPTHN